MNPTPLPLSKMHVFRVWNPRTREIYATPGASSPALAERTVAATAARYPGAVVHVYRAGQWLPWLRTTDA